MNRLLSMLAVVASLVVIRALGSGAVDVLDYAVSIAFHRNFHEVIPGELYRSGEMPRDELTTILRKHRIHTVIDLRLQDDEPDESGITEAQARDYGRPVLMGTMPMARVSRAKERGETQGLMKVLVDARSKRILGAAILGIGGDEVVQTLLQLMAGDLPYTSMQQTMHIHPTVTELLPTLLADLKPLSPS